MSVGPGPRWVPFPVQDWSTLPADEWSDAPGGGTGSRRWLPWVVVLLVLALVAASLVITDRAALRLTAGSTAPSGSARYLPADGQVSYATRRTQTRTADVAATEVTESARYVGRQINAALDTTLAQRVLTAVEPTELTRARFLRTTTSVVGEQGPQRTEVWRTDGDVALVARTDGDRQQTYAPALVVLPADVTPGATWTGGGQTQDGTYLSGFAAAAGPADCLRVTGRVASTSRTGVSTIEEQTQTWCPGRGRLEWTVTSGTGATATRTTSTEQPAAGLADLVPTAPVTAPSERLWRPERWTEHRYGVASVDPQLTSAPMTDAAAGTVPAVTASGLLFRAGGSSRDVYALTPHTADAWRTLWRLHPGGTVLSVTALGDVVVLATSSRQLVGYDDAGARLWTYDAGELVAQPPIGVGPDRLAAVTVAGRLTMLDLRTGRPRWTTATGTDVGVAPALVGDPDGTATASTAAVVVVGRDGTVVAHAASDGSRRWQLSATAPQRVVPLGADRMVLVDDIDLDAVDVATGTRVWRRPARDSVVAATPFGDRAVVATRVATLLLDRDGRVTRFPPYRRLDVDGARDDPSLVGWGAARADVLDTEGTVRTSFAVPGTGLGGGGATLAYRQGVWWFSATWDFRGWSDEP